MATLIDRIRSRTLSIPRRLRVLVITVLFLLVPFAIYFTLYISNQTSYIANRDFRQLASVSLQVEQRIDNLKEAFGNAVKNTVEKNFESQQATKNPVAKTDAQPSPPVAPTFKQSLAILGTGFVVSCDE